MDIKEILMAAVKYGASDIHIVPDRKPFLRISGEMRGLNTDLLTAEDTERLIYGCLTEKLIDKFKVDGELDTSVNAEGIGRFRMNILRQKDGIGAVMRVIPSEIPNPEDVGLDDTIIGLKDTPRGLILVTGPTGSGKSTTLASMMNLINMERSQHIITIEDPIEYIYPQGNCVVTQREIGSHTKDFGEALKRAMRQDPDVALVGEMRDLETISAALTLAETGHLVFATLHTTDAPQTVDRIIDVFPPFQQQQIRTQLSGVLKAVICQQLLPTADGKGRVAAREIMLVNSAIANLIREGKTHQIYSAIDTGGRSGMKSLDKDMASLVQRGLITRDVALSKANNPKLMETFLSQGGGGY
ncbi:MAG: type IV pilus twitching motility protein PilT [Elusimicrobia bacterium]|nr:type IV pilus twitching motility protein PilT [Elusimicrobiota bacterium]